MKLAHAIILKNVNYSDTQKIIHAYTREMGYLSFISPAFIFKKRNCAVNTMQIVEMEFFENEKGNLHKLKSASPISNTSAIYFDIYKMNIALLWSEVLNLILKNEQKNENLFDFVTQSVEYLNSAQNDIGNFNLFFLYRLTTLMGFSLNAHSWSEGFVFNVNDGCFCPPGPESPYISGPNSARVIHRLCTCQLEELKDIKLNRESRSVLLDIIFLFFGIHLNVDFNIKSIQVIREVFA